jgi:hypothetical protein
MCQNTVSNGTNQQKQQHQLTTATSASEHAQQMTVTSCESQQTALSDPKQQQQQQLTDQGGQQLLQQQLAALADQQQHAQKQLPTKNTDQKQPSAVVDQLTNGRVRRDGTGGSQSATSSPYPARLRNPVLEQYRLQASPIKKTAPCSFFLI